MHIFAAFVDPLVEKLESLAWIGQSTHIVNLPVLDNAIQPLADSLGMQLTIIKYLLGLFAVYPFSAVLYHLPNKNAKHFFSMIVGLFLVQWIFGPDWIHTFISSVVTYLLCIILPKKYQPVIVFIWVMGYMTMSHLYRMYVSYLSGVFDFTGTQMVITMKLTSFAYNLYDGTYDYKKVFATDHNPKEAKMYAQRKKFAITSLPNPLEFFGYVYCFTCILAGPAFEYNDYVQSIDGTTFLVKESDGKEKLKKPSTVLPALKCLVIAVVCMVGYLQINGRHKINDQFDPTFIASFTMGTRFIYLLIAMFGERLKFYFAWKIAEGASILAGFGFEGYDKSGKVIGWKGVENIDMIGFETAPNVQTATRVWNKRTQGWLERYTYMRAGKSLFAVYLISALWHGLYPGFFFVFLSVPALTAVERLAKQKLNPIFCPGYDGYNNATYPKTTTAQIYWYVCTINTLLGMNYIVQAFTMGSLENTLAAYGAYKYIGHAIILAAYIFLTILPKPKTVEKEGKKKD